MFMFRENGIMSSRPSQAAFAFSFGSIVGDNKNGRVHSSSGVSVDGHILRPVLNSLFSDSSCGTCPWHTFFFKDGHIWLGSRVGRSLFILSLEPKIRE